MRSPGDLRELGAPGEQAWSQFVTQTFACAASAINGSDGFLQESIDDDSGVTTTDWSGFPVRIADCLTRQRALRVLDVRGATVDGGGRHLQEEYLEWRAVKCEGIVTRVELTTELSDYWRVLAAHRPQRLLELVAEFSGDTVSIADVFGDADVLRADGSPAEREACFARTMLGPAGRSPYNDGRRAICCMVQPSNNLASLVRLAFAATACRVIRDAAGDRLRCLTCLESMPFIADAARLGRASDPVLVERLGRLAYEGRRVAFDDPIGVYVAGVQHTRLRTPRGDLVPAEWFVLSRGMGPDEAVDGRARHQRLVLEVPPDEDFVVGDLVDIATEQPIRHGGQVADLLVLAVRLRVSERDAIEVDRGSPVDRGDPFDDPEGCARVRDYERQVLAVGEPA